MSVMITFSRPKPKVWWHHINWFNVSYLLHFFMSRGRFRTAATSKMECFVIMVNGWKPLTIITKHTILDVAAALDSPLTSDDSLVIYKSTSLQRTNWLYACPKPYFSNHSYLFFILNLWAAFKGTLMQIWKSTNIFVFI